MELDEALDLSANIAEIDIYRAAKMMIEIYGNDAGIRAALRADYFYRDGDMEGFETWKRIVSAVGELQVMKPLGTIN